MTVTVMVLRSKYRNAFLYDTLLQRLATDPRILGCEHSTCWHRAVPLTQTGCRQTLASCSTTSRAWSPAR